MRKFAQILLTAVALAAAVLFPAPAHATTPKTVFAYYYAWFPAHWGAGQSLRSPYYPTLGRYGSTDPITLYWHMAWLRQAGADVLVYSWWGQSSPENATVTPVLDAAAQAGLKVSFILEPYPNRTSAQTMGDIRYLYDTYGSHPAFYRWARQTWASPNLNPRGVFFLYNPVTADGSWPAAVATLRGTSYDPILLARQDDGLLSTYGGLVQSLSWGNFDGVFNYGALDYGRDALPLTDPSFVTVPQLSAGFDNRKVGGSTVQSREGGALFERNWSAVVGANRFETVALAFNEWGEGSQVEPAQPRFGYQNYNPLAQDYYLTRAGYWSGRLRQ